MSPAEPALTTAERAVLALARKERWPHALLTPEMEVVGGPAARASWMHVKRRLKQVGRERMLALRWPQGTTGAVLKLAGGGWLLLGLFRRGGRGPSPAQLKALGGLVREQSRLERTLAAKEQALDAVMRLGHALSSIKDLESLVRSQIEIVPELVHLLNADRASVFLIDEETKELYSVVALGAEIKEIRFPLSRGLAGYVARTGEALNIPDAHLDPRFNPEFDRKTGYRTRSILAVALHDPQGRRIGVVQAINKQGSEVFTKDDEKLLDAFASEWGIAIANVRLISEQRELFDSFVTTMAAALDARDAMTAGHTHRVTEYSKGIAEQLGMTREQVQRRVHIAGMLHDMGKIGTPDAVLKKAGGLTTEERKIIEQHAAYTRTIVRNLKLPPELQGVAEEAAGHHERMDGSGYPDGLTGDRIPLVARLMAVADVFDAITSKRHYRDAMPIDEALAVIRNGRGAHFDPVCVDAFFRYYEAKLRDRFAGRGGPPRDGAPAA